MTNALTYIGTTTVAVSVTNTISFENVDIGPAYVGRMLIITARWTHHNFSSYSSLKVDGFLATKTSTQRTSRVGSAVCFIDKDTGITANIDLHLTQIGTSAEISVYAVNPIDHNPLSIKSALSAGPAVSLVFLTTADGGFEIMSYAGDQDGTVHVLNDGADTFTVDDDTTLPGEGERSSLTASCLNSAGDIVRPGIEYDSGSGAMCLAGASWGPIVPDDEEPPPPPPASGNITFAEEFEPTYHDWVIYERNLNGAH